MSIDSIGQGAARLWQLMNDGTTWTYTRISQELRLPDRAINAAIGWLAREDTLEIITDPVSGEETYKVRHFWELDGM